MTIDNNNSILEVLNFIIYSFSLANDCNKFSTAAATFILLILQLKQESIVLSGSLIPDWEQMAWGKPLMKRGNNEILKIESSQTPA